jgi:hypothetical protein
MPASTAATQARRQVPARNNEAQQRQLKVAALLRKEAALARALESEAGLRKIAANMANPVRQKLDYKGIFRKFCVVEQMPDGVPLLFDRDQPQVPAIKIGQFGTSRMVEMVGKRIELTAFEIVARPKIPYSELYNRRYRALDRAKDRLIEGIELREDLLGFSLFATAATAGAALANGPTVVTTAGPLDRDSLAKTFTQVEKNRLVVAAVLMSPYGTQGIRRLDFQHLDQVGMQEVRETGYLGSMWGADFYVSDQMTAGTAYCLTTPKFLAWMPLRKDLDVIPADDPDNLRLGLVGYELIGLTVHNPFGVGTLNFNTAA